MLGSFLYFQVDCLDFGWTRGVEQETSFVCRLGFNSQCPSILIAGKLSSSNVNSIPAITIRMWNQNWSTIEANWNTFPFELFWRSVDIGDHRQWKINLIINTLAAKCLTSFIYSFKTAGPSRTVSQFNLTTSHTFLYSKCDGW